MLQWMFFEQYDHEPAIAVVRFWLAYSGRAEAFADRVDERTAAGYRALDAMEKHLAEGDREFFVGDGMTLADIALYAYTHVAPEGGFDLSGYPAIRGWLDGVADARARRDRRLSRGSRAEWRTAGVWSSPRPWMNRCTLGTESSHLPG